MKCLYCGNDFDPVTSRQRFCSVSCQRKLYKINHKIPESFTCLNCGKEFYPKAKDRTKYCCRECAFEHKKAQAKPKIKLQKEIKICIICNNKYKSNNNNQKCCSKKCANIRAKEKYLEQKNELNKQSRDRYRKKHNITLKEIICKECGKSFIQQKASEKKFCSRECSNKNFRRIHKHKTKARKHNLPKTFTAKQWRDVKKYFNNRCVYCGRTTDVLHQEHFIAESKGGGYTQNNIIPACSECNINKANKDFFEWYPKWKYYSKIRENKLLKYLRLDKQGQQQLALII